MSQKNAVKVIWAFAQEESGLASKTEVTSNFHGDLTETKFQA
jgi:hypothetical protein